MTAARKLIAFDGDDLAVISTHVQDATVAVRDIIWQQREKRLVVAMSRLDWDQTFTEGLSARRLAAALRFDRVLSCKSKHLDVAPDETLDLVGIDFSSTDVPGGVATLMFANGGMLRLELECLECELADLHEEAAVTDDSAMPAAAPGLRA